MSSSDNDIWTQLMIAKSDYSEMCNALECLGEHTPVYIVKSLQSSIEARRQEIISLVRDYMHQDIDAQSPSECVKPCCSRIKELQRDDLLAKFRSSGAN